MMRCPTRRTRRRMALLLAPILTCLSGALLGCAQGRPTSSDAPLASSDPTSSAGAPAGTPTSALTGTAVPTHADIAALLAHPSAPGDVVEIDAFYAGAYGWGGPGWGRAESMTHCPSRMTAPLTDRPLPLFLRHLDTTQSNVPPESAAWLVATDAEGSVQPELPYHARFQGHFAEDAFAHCDDAGRIFVIEEVVAVYEPSIEALQAEARRGGAAAWPRVRDAARGYSTGLAPGWTVEGEGTDLVAFRHPAWPTYPITLTVREGEIAMGDRASYRQRLPQRPEVPPLLAQEDECPAPVGEQCIAVSLSGRGRTYELRVVHPVGLEAPQALLDALTGMVDRFEIEGMATRTPTPEVATTLGEGPFIARPTAEARAMELIPWKTFRVEELELVTEAEARALRRCDIDYGATSRDDARAHPQAVWVARLTGAREDGTQATYFTYLDAVSGMHLCTAEEGDGPTREGG